MKIICTPKEYARMICICEDGKIFETDPCCGCMMKGYCPDNGGIVDSGVVELVQKDGDTIGQG